MDSQALKTYGIFGASLSAQGIRHDTGEFVGYVEYLRNEYAEQIGTKRDLIKSYTYSGNRLSDGGIVKLSEVLIEKPNICIFEPLIEDVTRGKWAKPSEIKWVYSRLIEQEIVPFTFMVALPVGRKIEELPVTRTIRQICHEYNLPIFDADIDAIVADGAEFNGVHTLTHSGRLLAKQLAIALQHLDYDQIRKNNRSLNIPTPNIFIQEIAVPSFNLLHRLSIDIIPKDIAPYQVRLIQLQDIGIYSPIISVNIYSKENSEIEKQEISIWDPYCHYTRQSFVTLVHDTVPLNGPASITIEVSSTSPAYKTCRRSVNSWPSFDSRMLKPKGALNLVSNHSVTCNLTSYD